MNLEKYTPIVEQVMRENLLQIATVLYLAQDTGNSDVDFARAKALERYHREPQFQKLVCELNQLSLVSINKVVTAITSPKDSPYQRLHPIGFPPGADRSDLMR